MVLLQDLLSLRDFLLCQQPPGRLGQDGPAEEDEGERHDGDDAQGLPPVDQVGEQRHEDHPDRPGDAGEPDDHAAVIHRGYLCGDAQRGLEQGHHATEGENLGKNCLESEGR